MDQSGLDENQFLAFAAIRDWDADRFFRIYVSRLDGSDLRCVSTGEGPHQNYYPAWSPDGALLLFDNDASVGLTRAGDWSVTSLSVDVHVAVPEWLSGGTRILFVGRRESAGETGEEESSAWYVMDVDGRHRRRLFADWQHLSELAPAPDGRLFAATHAGDASGFRILDADGTSLEVVATPYRVVQALSWSPDGGHIAFSALDDEDETESSLYVLRRVDGAVLKIDRLAAEGHVVWSPDGRRIAYTGEQGYEDILYVVAPDGSDRRMLSPLNEGAISGELMAPRPTWSPDAQHVATSNCVADDRGNFAIDIYSVDGYLERRLVPGFALVDNAAWQPSRTPDADG